MEQKKENCPNCEVIRMGHVMRFDNNGKCIICGRTVWPGMELPAPTLTFKDPGSSNLMSATLWSMLPAINHEATRAREYLRLTGETCTPDRIHEILHLKTSRATLARKMREACRRGELLRRPYINERGTEIAAYSYNPDYKE